MCCPQQWGATEHILSPTGEVTAFHLQQVQPNSLPGRTDISQAMQTTSHLHEGHKRFIPASEEMKREVNCPTAAWPFLTIYWIFHIRLFPSLQWKGERTDTTTLDKTSSPCREEQEFLFSSPPWKALPDCQWPEHLAFASGHLCS